MLILQAEQESIFTVFGGLHILRRPLRLLVQLPHLGRSRVWARWSLLTRFPSHLLPRRFISLLFKHYACIRET